MTLTQSWVGYLDRSYEQIKKSCLKRLGVVAPEISDHSESNPLIVILSMFAGIAEMLNLYIDSAAREVFIGTARRYSSAVRLVKLIDYNIRARNPAGVNILFYLLDDNGDPIVAPSDIVIPLGTIITDVNSGIPFVLQAEVTIKTGNQNVYGKALQYQQVNGDLLGNTNGTQNQKVLLPDDYADGSLTLTIDGETWLLFRTFGTMYPDTKGFIVNIDEDSNAFIEFGDGVNGKVPLTGKAIFGDYRVSQGALGNLPPDSISDISNPPVVPAGVNLRANNPDYSSGGSNFESLAEIQNRAPRSIRTLDRAVTYQDYLDLCYQVLGVGAAEVSYCCGKYVDVYIAPNSPGTATLALLQAVQDYLACRVMITTQVSVKAAGISKIWIKAKIYGKPLKIGTDIYDEVVDDLDLKFGFPTLKINKPVSISDIIAEVEGLSTVDRIEIEQVRILPFARAMNGNNILNLDFLVLPKTNVPVKYTLIFRTATNKFELYKAGVLTNVLYAVGDTYTDAELSFTILAGTYNNGDKWEFTAYPSYPEIFPSNLIEIKDFSAPIIEVGPLIDANTPRTIFSDLQIITQGTTVSCLPPC